MALHAAEEESLEALKKWWQDNGKGLIYTAVAVFAGVTGWFVWVNSTASQAEAASDLYEEILSITLVEEGERASAADSARVIELAENLRSGSRLVDLRQICFIIFCSAGGAER